MAALLLQLEHVELCQEKLFEVCAAAIGAFSFAEQNINRSTCLQRDCLLSHEAFTS